MGLEGGDIPIERADQDDFAPRQSGAEINPSLDELVLSALLAPGLVDRRVETQDQPATGGAYELPHRFAIPPRGLLVSADIQLLRGPLLERMRILKFQGSRRSGRNLPHRPRRVFR